MGWLLISIEDFVVTLLFVISYVFIGLGGKIEVFKNVINERKYSFVGFSFIITLCIWFLRYFYLMTVTFQTYVILLFSISLMIELMRPLLIGDSFQIDSIFSDHILVRTLSIVILFMLFIGMYLNTPSTSYTIASNILQPKTMTFDEFINSTTFNETITIIPYDTAKRKIGVAMSKWGSYYRVVDVDYQVNGSNIYWIGSIGFDGITRQFSHKSEGVPVYILDATKITDAQQVQLKCKMKYSLGNYLGLSIDRYIYEHYPSYVHSVPVLQVYDGVPYYVSMLSKYTEFSYAKKPVKIIIVNACDGSIEEHSISDNINISHTSFYYQEDVVEDMVYNWGVYVHGLKNKWFSGKDVKYPTGNIKITEKDGKRELSMSGSDTWLIVLNGRPYWFTAFRPPGSDQSINSMIGMGFVDALTGKMTYVETDNFYNDYAAMNNILKSPEISKTSSLIPTQPYPLFIDKKMVWFSPIVSTDTYEIYEFAVVDPMTGKVYIDDKVDKVINKWLSDTGSSTSVEVNETTSEKGNIIYYVIIDKKNGTIIRIPIELGDKINIVPVNQTKENS